MLRRLRSLVFTLLSRTRIERELDEELRFHLDARADDLVGRGLSRSAAERQARLEFGAVDGYKDDCREARGLRFLDELRGNLRFAGRSLGHAPGVTAVAVLSLALGIGANIAIFSLVNAVVLKPLPVSDPGRLVLLRWQAKDFPERYVDAVEGDFDSDAALGIVVSSAFPSAVFEAVPRARALSHVVAFAGTSPANVALAGHAGSGELLGVSGNYFDALGVVPAVGRALHASDEGAGQETAVVASWAFWRQALGQTPPGTVLVVNGTPMTLVGVTPPEFAGLKPGQTPDLYVALHTYTEHYRRAFSYDLRDPRVWWLNIVGRLRPGIGEAQATAELSSLFRGAAGIDDRDAGGAMTPKLSVTTASRGLDDLRKEYSTVLWLLAAMAGIVLLVACANVASLLFARAAARERDIAVRLSLGASRQRIVRQFLTEAIVLGLLGGLLGLLAGAWVTDAANGALVGSAASLPARAGVDGRVLLFTLLVSIASALVFGVVPALRVTGRDLGQSLARRADAGLAGRRSLQSGKLLVAAQVALCVALLVGAGLLRGTLSRLQRADLGFDPARLVVLRVQPGLNAYGKERLAAFYDNLLRAVSAAPGVQAVALSQHSLIGEGWSQGMAEVTGTAQPVKKARFWRHWVSAGFFETIGIPLVTGRLLSEADGPTAPHAVVVNRRFVREHLHGEDPIGRTFRDGRWTATIVGVVGDTKYGSVRDEAPPTAYMPYLQYVRGMPESMTLEARVGGDVEAGLASVRQAALSVDAAVPPVRVGTEVGAIEKALFTERALALLSAAFGSLALLLAAVGLFGTLSYAVARRTGEIGVRMALGAQRQAVVRMVLRETLVITVFGLLAGLPLAWMGGRLMARQLFGVSPHDPATIAAVVVGILGVALVSGALPAARASRVNPMTALRDE